MKIIALLISIIAVVAPVLAAELKISTAEPLVVSTPRGWQGAVGTAPTAGFPFATCRIEAQGERNAVCMISILDKNRAAFKNPELLKRILRGDSRPYLNSAEEASEMVIQELTIREGLGFYANFVDPDLVGKPTKKGSYKTATPLILSIGTDYLIKATIFCDDLKSPDYTEAVQIVTSIRVVKPDA
jgi:hypothetical protein